MSNLWASAGSVVVREEIKDLAFAQGREAW